jgi:hypothetical protein
LHKKGFFKFLKKIIIFGILPLFKINIGLQTQKIGIT